MYLTNLTNDAMFSYMSETLNIYEAKTHLSALVEKAAAGEEIVIAKAGKPMAKLVPLEPKRKIRLGLFEGEFQIPDDFDDPLPEDILRDFGY